RVVLTSGLTRAGLETAPQVTTGARGEFDFGPQRASSYDVTAAAPGRGEGTTQVTTLDPAARPPADALTIVLPGCANALEGVVRDASGGVIAGAELGRARGTFGGVTPIGLGTVTDEQGAYTLCTPPGPMTAIVRADGYGTVTVLDTVIGHRRRDVELIPAATVSGTVVRAEDRRPVANAVVFLRPWGYPPRVRSTPDTAVSDADGHFRFTGAAPGRYTVGATTGQAMTPPTSVSVVLDPGQDVDGLVVPVAALPVEIEGRVVEDGKPLAGALVYAVYDGHAQGGGGPPSDGDGRFRIRLSQPATIRFEVDGHEVVAPATFDAKAGTSSVTVEARPRGAIRGIVRRAGQPVGGATVTALSPVRPRLDVTAAADGSFELRGLPAGHYALYAQSYAAEAFTGKEVDVDLAAREEQDGVVLELDGAASIAGTVVDQDGAPVADVSVRWTLADTGDLCDATTARDGAFHCVMISGGGTYAPLVRLDERSALTLPAATPDGLAPVKVPDGDSRITGVVLRVRLARATIRGRVVDLAGAPYPDVTVRTIEASTGYTPATAPWTGEGAAITDVDGRFELPVVADATYTLHARAPGGAEASLPGVTAGGPEPVLRLGRAGRIVGTLAGFTARPRILVRAVASAVEVQEAAVDGDRFVVAGLSAGRYGVMALVGAQAAAASIDVPDGADATVTLRARPTTRLTGRVFDFVGGGPASGARCAVVPFVAGNGIAGDGFAVNAAPPADADGRFTLEAPTGELEVSCHGEPWRFSDGAARLTAGDGAADVSIAVVFGEKDAYDGPSIGVRIGFAYAPAGGHLLTIVELRPGGSGQRAGLAVGDLVTAVDGRDVTMLTDGGLLTLFARHAVGDVVQVTIRRGAASLTLPVTVEGPWYP
ncbi:MAG TPA: carboxypeptidase regulatory-like domain-containing protein, partial [Kofleriaceae bacterium]|nr:carboxypeptidase regulatory-like domain-containing protein [Kofleriaceae bacterium]